MSKSIKLFNTKVVLIYVFYFHTIWCFPTIRKSFLDNCSHRNAASCFQYSFRCFSLGTPTFSIYGSPRACLQAASNQTCLERSIPVNLPRTQIGIQTRDLIFIEDQTCANFSWQFSAGLLHVRATMGWKSSCNQEEQRLSLLPVSDDY